MIEELKIEVEKNFGRKITNRGDCELLTEDLFKKLNVNISYNTLRRLFGISEYRKPRESTLDILAQYIGFNSYQDFTKRFHEIDVWPIWQQLYVTLATGDSGQILEFLRARKMKQDQFSITFTIAIRELINRKDTTTLLLIFREPIFQFEQLPFDEVTQIGVLIGLHFSDFHDQKVEEALLMEPNFRDLVVKIFVDYSGLNAKYGKWIHYLNQLDSIDDETLIFTNCLLIWKKHLNKELVYATDMETLPELNMDQHPILFGRLFGLKFLFASTKPTKNKLIKTMKMRLESQPQFTTELLYEPAVQALVLANDELGKFVLSYQNQINQIQFWYHLSQIAIHKIFQVKDYILKKQFNKARNTLENTEFAHIRFGYKELIAIYVTFFRLEIAKSLKEDTTLLMSEFQSARQKIAYPLLDEDYFENYFSEKN
jgi:hypothetical protein